MNPCCVLLLFFPVKRWERGHQADRFPAETHPGPEEAGLKGAFPVVSPGPALLNKRIPQDRDSEAAGRQLYPLFIVANEIDLKTVVVTSHNMCAVPSKTTERKLQTIEDILHFFLGSLSYSAESLGATNIFHIMSPISFSV